MGYMRHHAVVVASSIATLLDAAHAEAKRLFGDQVSNIVSGVVNDDRSFFVGPDASKEGWSESDEGDSARAKFIDYLNSQRYEDGSSSLKWVVVQFGDDENETKVCNDSDEEARARRKKRQK